MPDHDKEARFGLTWPDDYRDILPVIQAQWGIHKSIYLSRRLSGGRSGAHVFAADVDSSDYTGQAILKLD